jgi:hypothetical protein
MQWHHTRRVRIGQAQLALYKIGQQHGRTAVLIIQGIQHSVRKEYYYTWYQENAAVGNGNSAKCPSSAFGKVLGMCVIPVVTVLPFHFTFTLLETYVSIKCSEWRSNKMGA